MKEACSAAKVIFTIPIYQQIEQQKQKHYLLGVGNKTNV